MPPEAGGHRDQPAEVFDCWLTLREQRNKYEAEEAKRTRRQHR